MKKLLSLALIFVSIVAMAQKKMDFVRKSSYPISDNDSLVCYYFPVKSNMANPALPYYKEKPNLDDVLQVAMTMPCDSFVVLRDGNAIMTINLRKDSTWTFRVKEKRIGLDTIVNSELIGAITEHRSIELINNGYDKKAGQVFGKFNFNNKQIPYVTTKNMENAVFKVVESFLYEKKQK